LGVGKMVVRGQAGSHAVVVGTVAGTAADVVELRLLEEGCCEGHNPAGLDSLDRPVPVAAENLVAAAREHVVGAAGMPDAALLEVVAAATADGWVVGIAVADIEAAPGGDVAAGVWVDEGEELGIGGVRTVAVLVVHAPAGGMLLLVVDVHVADVAVVARRQDADAGSVDLSQEPEDLRLPPAPTTFATANNESTARDTVKPLLTVPGLHAGTVSVSGHRRVGGSGVSNRKYLCCGSEIVFGGL
ncbi:unnamed protein product, partial [Symbiodinium sp. CCMP2456]